VRVVLLRILEKSADGEWGITWTGPVPINWRNGVIYAPERTVGAEADADLCSVVKGKWLELHPMVVPMSLKARYRNEPVDIVLHFQAQGAEASSPVLAVHLAWDGKWADGDREMLHHLVIRTTTAEG
jgi:hypothetical protein